MSNAFGFKLVMVVNKSPVLVGAIIKFNTDILAQVVVNYTEDSRCTSDRRIPRFKVEISILKYHTYSECWTSVGICNLTYLFKIVCVYSTR